MINKIVVTNKRVCMRLAEKRLIQKTIIRVIE